MVPIFLPLYYRTIDPVTLETEANISCVAVNQVGQGKPDFIAIQVIGKFLFIFLAGKFRYYSFFRFDIILLKILERILYLCTPKKLHNICNWKILDKSWNKIAFSCRFFFFKLEYILYQLAQLSNFILYLK